MIAAVYDGPSVITQILMFGVLVAAFLLLKKEHGYAGVCFTLGFLGMLFAAYHGVGRLNNYIKEDDVAGAILLGIVIFALLGMGCFLKVPSNKNQRFSEEEPKK